VARKLSHTLVVSGELVALTPLSIGGATAGLVTDMPLAIDGLGRFYLPGTSLGGAIRAYLGGLPQDERWGFAAGQDQGSAARIIIDDAPALGQPVAEIWHGNGIDRRWGGTADQIKYDREVLPRGTRFGFRLSLEVLQADDVDIERAWLAQLIQSLEAGLVPLGAGGTRGLGRMRLEATCCHERNWDTPEGILAFLTPTPPKDSRSAWCALAGRLSLGNPRPQVRLRLHWRPRGPLMSKAARDGIVVDGLPFLSRRDDGDLALTLPGAGIKGAWRTQAERIVRTVTGKDYGLTDAKHHRQIDVPLAADLFGRARPEDPAPGKAAPTRRKGRLAVETCYADFALPQARWDELESSEEQWRAPPDPQRPMTMAMHVAVDRWTGGAADNLLYSAVEPAAITWRPITMHFDATPNGKAGDPETSTAPLAELALLWLTLRDFCAGQIPLGFGVNRGYGDLEVERVDLSGLTALDHATDSEVLRVTNGELDTDPVKTLLVRVKAAWQQWLEQERTA
jgi:CRISPR/Cas system CSM-associated protein Csm3 (group 7 of RAMP superfamily)